MPEVQLTMTVLMTPDMPLSPKDSAPLYVEIMGGSAKIIAKGKELIGQGKYNEASEILNKLVFAQPGNQEAKNLLADAFEQLGYQKESPTLRNIFRKVPSNCATGCLAAHRSGRRVRTRSARCRPRTGSTSWASAWTRATGCASLSTWSRPTTAKSIWWR